MEAYVPSVQEQRLNTKALIIVAAMLTATAVAGAAYAVTLAVFIL